MADRPRKPFFRALIPSRSEVDSAKLRAERDEVEPVIATPADELDRTDQLAATPPVPPSDIPPLGRGMVDDQLMAEELDHAGLEVDDDPMGDFRNRREEPWVSWPSI
jgi:hypothetical protein